MFTLLNVAKKDILNVKQQQILLNKIIFTKYCDHFKTKTLSELLDDTTFIKYVEQTITHEPTLHSRAFQLALEVSYHKRHFSQKMLEKYFENDFLIVDTFKVNKQICDQSTIYSAVQTKIFKTHFNYNKADIIVHSTPLFLSKNNITPEMQANMDTNLVLTKNTAPDLSVSERPYDFKDSKEFSYGKNHMYFIDQEMFKIYGEKHLRNMESALRNTLNNHNKNHYLSKETEKYTENILAILNNKTPQETLEAVYLFIKKSIPPRDFKLPFFFIKKKAKLDEFINDVNIKEIENISLDQGHLNDVKAKKAIMGIINNWDSSIKQKVQEATNYSIPMIDKESLD